MKVLRFFKRGAGLFGAVAAVAVLALAVVLVPSAATGGGVALNLVADGDGVVDNAGFTDDVSSGAINGSVNLEILRDGSYQFTGHVHNDGSGTKQVTVACVLHINSSNEDFTFGAQGQVLGDVGAVVNGSNKSYDWNTSGVEPGVAQFFGDLSSSNPRFECSMASDDRTLQDVEQTLGATGKIIGQVVPVVTAVLAIF